MRWPVQGQLRSLGGIGVSLWQDVDDDEYKQSLIHSD